MNKDTALKIISFEESMTRKISGLTTCFINFFFKSQYHLLNFLSYGYLSRINSDKALLLNDLNRLTDIVLKQEKEIQDLKAINQYQNEINIRLDAKLKLKIQEIKDLKNKDKSIDNTHEWLMRNTKKEVNK